MNLYIVAECLLTVDVPTAIRLKLKPGQEICRNCHKLQDAAEITESPSQIDLDFVPHQNALASLNKAVGELDCSPVKRPFKLNKRDRVSYGKRKVTQMKSSLLNKCGQALDLKDNQLESNSDSTDEEETSDTEILMGLLREKIKTSSRQEKIKLLTLVPHSWTKKKTVEFFQVSQHMVKRARQLKKEKGILANPSPKTGGRAIPEAVKQRVHEFYQSSEFSRVCPGKKEYVSVYINGEKIQKQKQLLLVNLKELHLEYLQKFPNDKVGFSKFCDLRPKWCVPVTAAGMHSVCVCEQHQNAKLITAALPYKIEYKELLTKIVCNVENRNCMLHLCDSCPGKSGLHNYLNESFESLDFDLDDIITYKQWRHQSGGTDLLSLNVTIQEFIAEATSAFDSIRQHHYIAKAQSLYLSTLKDELPNNEGIILLDFAENFSFLVQDAVQGYHWNNSQATLHPFVFYYKENGELKCLNQCVISDCLKHDTLAVHAFQTPVIAYVKMKCPSVNKIHYFSDGCGGQYKNFKNFSNLCHHKHDFAIEATWHFFATSHGKSPCDGLGGTVKRLVARASLQAPLDGQIMTPKDMFEWCIENIPGITFHYISTEDVKANEKSFNLEARFGQAKTINGTRSHHCFIPTGDCLMMKRISADNDHTLIGDPNPPPDTYDHFQPGKYVAAMYDTHVVYWLHYRAIR